MHSAYEAIAASSWRIGYPMKYDSTRTSVSEQSGKDPRSLSILLADNNPDDVALFEDMIAALKNDPFHRMIIALTRVNSMRAVRELLNDGHSCDAILFDFNLLDTRHEETVKHMMKYAVKIPSIVLTDIHDETIAIKALKSGIQDYIIKGEMKPSLFYRAIYYAIERFKIFKERENLIASLHKTIDEIKTLSGLLAICIYCKKIRDSKGYWAQLEAYISSHSGAKFSHGICPDCARNVHGMKADTQMPEMTKHITF